MIISFITLFILNVLFIIFLDKIAKTIDIYDVPDNKLKLHKKKNPNYWWFDLDYKFFNNFHLPNFIFKKIFNS